MWNVCGSILYILMLAYVQPCFIYTYHTAVIYKPGVLLEGRIVVVVFGR